MTLADAIRLGAMLKPQAFHAPSRYGPSLSDEQATCALAAAAEAAGDSILSVCAKPWIARWPRSHDFVGCPAGCMDSSVLTAIIAHLNDTHRWTREHIADWVEMIELADRKEEEVDHVRTAQAV
jgi:hypothetical protein